VYVDLFGPKLVASIGGKRYVMLVRDCYSRYTWLYFLRNKSDTTEAFKKFLCDVRAEGTPSEVQTVRSDLGGEFSVHGPFGSLCRDRNIRQEFTTSSTPERNSVAERAIALAESAALAARLHAPELYPNMSIPNSKWIWAEGLSWAVDSLNSTCTSANTDFKSPYEVWFGKSAPVKVLPFLKPAICKTQRDNKLDPKGMECFYLGPAPNHASDVYRVLTKRGTVIATRDITWRRVCTDANAHTGNSEGSRPENETVRSGEGRDICEAEVHVPIPFVSTQEPAEQHARGIHPDSVEPPPVDATGSRELPSSDVSVEPKPVDAASSRSLPNNEVLVEPEQLPNLVTVPPSSTEGVEQDQPSSQQGHDEVKSSQPDNQHGGPPSSRTRSKASAPDLSVSFLTSSFPEFQSMRDSFLIDSVKDRVGHAMAATEVSLNNPVEIPYIPLTEIEAEPMTYQQAMSSKYKNIWVSAMNSELKGLELSGTFNNDVMPTDRKAVSSRWIYKWKTDSSGRVVKAKARLVAREFSQVEGIDYFDTFSPTPAMTSIRMLAA